MFPTDDDAPPGLLQSGEDATTTYSDVQRGDQWPLTCEKWEKFPYYFHFVKHTFPTGTRDEGLEKLYHGLFLFLKQNAYHVDTVRLLALLEDFDDDLRQTILHAVIFVPYANLHGTIWGLGITLPTAMKEQICAALTRDTAGNIWHSPAVTNSPTSRDMHYHLLTRIWVLENDQVPPPIPPRYPSLTRQQLATQTAASTSLDISDSILGLVDERSSNPAMFTCDRNPDMSFRERAISEISESLFSTNFISHQHTDRARFERHRHYSLQVVRTTILASFMHIIIDLASSITLVSVALAPVSWWFVISM
jgi:hypothetical protein